MGAKRASTPRLPAWPSSTQEAIALQRELACRVITTDRLGKVSTVAGVDVGFKQHNQIAHAAVVVLSYPRLEPLEQAAAVRPVEFPYVPGLLSFREIPVILDAYAKLAVTPDLLLCDGQGLAHPRRFGIASHLGVLLDSPAIGVAKSRLIGKHRAVGRRKGNWQPLYDKEELIGAVLRTRTDVQPLYISIGHRVSLETAIKYVLACTTRFRLPETTRCAHRLASETPLSTYA